MLKSYLKVTLRTLRKQKVVSAVTIGSLAVGLACCLLLFLYVKREWTYDQFHAGADRIFRLVKVEKKPSGDRTRLARSPSYAGSALAEAFPEVEASVRFYGATVSIQRGDRTFEEEEITLADASVFDVFSFDLRRGSEETALDAPGGVVLSEEAAQRFFGEKNPVGRSLTVEFREGALEATVAGVAEAPPSGSSIPFEVVASFENMEKLFPTAMWGALGEKIPVARTYLRVSEAAEVDALEGRVADLLSERKANEESFTVGGNELVGHALQPLTDVHLDPGVDGGLAPPSSPVYSYVLAGIALLVLFLACINFVTLSLGRLGGRAREVGIRKAAGARREQVAGQFWGEALLLTLFALVLGVGLARMALPVFSRLAAQELSFGFESASLWIVLAGLLLVVGLVAGGYPALVLSRFAPASVLRRSRGALGGRSRFSKTLVVVQFALSVALVTGALVVSQQLRYTTQKDLGFDMQRVVAVNAEMRSVSATELKEGKTPDDTEIAQLYERFRREALQQTGVEAVAGSFPRFLKSALSANISMGDTATVRALQNAVSYNFAEVMAMEFLAGRNLRKNEAARDSLIPAVVNETLVRAAGWPSPEAAIGKDLSTDGLDGAEGVRIAGVVEDFNYAPLRQKIMPYFFVPRSARFGSQGSFLVRLGTESASGKALASLEDVWHRVASADAPFEYEFLSDIVRQKYETERRWQALVRYAAGLALLISCAGLFGLALLSVQRREKEIGIRKVLGANAWNVTALVAKQFALLVAVGFALAVPLAWYGARRWLQTFAYRIDLGAGPFLVAGLSVLAVAMATVAYQALRAARANPVDAIRQE